jgi:hypothetical protein
LGYGPNDGNATFHNSVDVRRALSHKREASMTVATLIGVAAIAIPLLVVFWFLFRKQLMIWWFACALLAVGLGYLASTGAAHDIGQRLVPAYAGKPI